MPAIELSAGEVHAARDLRADQGDRPSGDDESVRVKVSKGGTVEIQRWPAWIA